jgi:hypothetical protein
MNQALSQTFRESEDDFSDIAPYSLVEVYRRFTRACRLHHHVVITLMMAAATTSEMSVKF